MVCPYHFLFIDTCICQLKHFQIKTLIIPLRSTYWRGFLKYIFFHLSQFCYSSKCVVKEPKFYLHASTILIKSNSNNLKKSTLSPPGNSPKVHIRSVILPYSHYTQVCECYLQSYKLITHVDQSSTYESYVNIDVYSFKSRSKIQRKCIFN